MKCFAVVLWLSFSILFSISSFAETPEQTAALEAGKKYAELARKVALFKAQGATEEEYKAEKKGAFCVLARTILDVQDVSQLVFGRIYTKNATPEQKLAIENALINNYSDLFLTQIAPVLDAGFMWETATIAFDDTYRRDGARIPSFIMKVMKVGSAGKAPVEVELRLVPDRLDPAHLLVADMVLGMVRVSGYFGGYADTVKMGRRTLDEVLHDWSRQFSPCPEDLTPFQKYVQLDP